MSAPIVIEPGGAGYSEAGTWDVFSGGGRYSVGDNVASWTFATAAGMYTIATIWPTWGGASSIVLYRIEDPAGVLAEIPIDQAIGQAQAEPGQVLATVASRGTPLTVSIHLIDGRGSSVMFAGPVTIEDVTPPPSGGGMKPNRMVPQKNLRRPRRGWTG